ncbi:MAG: CBS domain-containing protein [Acidobacteria bacterium]|jgi:CBS domain-containing protein|nr:CBS domain-containing protein [Thermoanaerobaculia bacterium]NLN11144.1 CBS domain-containing protein [Acidobacteriota bacterium]MBP7813412.1 CBS domain-containing protein [Thermoanaerobaculia bacterium]MBP8844857.1 CBS domain-containing protein [Thermoanaerobaculia bacterium]HPA96259.1 CBS domain-containing protein [Thermoanaerobaculia bacterium]
MRQLVARDVMNSEVLTVRDDMSVEEVAAQLADNEISGAPVEDRDGRLVGVVSVTDIALAATSGGKLASDRSNPAFYVRGWEDRMEAEELAGLRLEGEGLLVREIMTPAVYSVPEDLPVSRVAETMIDSHIHRLLVTRGTQVVGIITTSDLLGLLVDEE